MLKCICEMRKKSRVHEKQETFTNTVNDPMMNYYHSLNASA